MSKYTKGFASFALAAMFLIISSVPTVASQNIKNERVPTAEEVFDAETFKKVKAQIDKNVFVEQDKVNQNNSKSVAAFSASATSTGFGSYPTRKGIILVTADAYKGLIPTGHAGIIYTSSTIVESLSGGVTTGKNNWNTTKQTCWGVTVKGTTTSQDSIAADYCYNKIGKPYNWNYLNPNTRTSFYCSQLVWASFKDNFNINLDTSAWGIAIHPVELVSSSLTSAIYEK